MKLVCISDTHGYTPELPDGDVLIHCGDYNRDSHWDKNLAEFVDWFGSKPHKHKILVPGNHDWIFEKEYGKAINTVGNKFSVLIDEGIEIDKIKFYGTPMQPRFYDWAFNRSATQRREAYSKIPNDTDILITHTPPEYILDEVSRGHVGCAVLAEYVQRIRPKYHVFGHIHEAYGVAEKSDTTYVNCVICDDMYQPVNKPVVLEI